MKATMTKMDLIMAGIMHNQKIMMVVFIMPIILCKNNNNLRWLKIKIYSTRFMYLYNWQFGDSLPWRQVRILRSCPVTIQLLFHDLELKSLRRGLWVSNRPFCIFDKRWAIFWFHPGFASILTSRIGHHVQYQWDEHEPRNQKKINKYFCQIIASQTC